MTPLNTIIEILTDCGVMAGKPDERRSIAEKALRIAQDPSDVETVARYLQATLSLEKVAGRLVQTVTDPTAYPDVLEIAKRWEARTADVEPGAKEREENTERERTRQSYGQERDAGEIYQAMMHGDPMQVKPSAKQLEQGAALCGHPCPKLAASLLLKGKRSELTLWNIWWHRSGTGPDGAFKSPRSLARAEKVERFRESMGWQTDGERETIDERRHRLEKRVKIRE